MITLSKSDIIFMLTILKLTPELHQVLERLVVSSGEVDEDTAEELRELCTECLDEVGFDENYEPTKDGEKLEELIDKLFVG